MVVSKEGNRYFEQNEPFEPLLALPGETAGHERATPMPGGQSQCGSVSPDIWTESGQTSILHEVSK